MDVMKSTVENGVLDIKFNGSFYSKVKPAFLGMALTSEQVRTSKPAHHAQEDEDEDVEEKVRHRATGGLRF